MMCFWPVYNTSLFLLYSTCKTVLLAVSFIATSLEVTAASSVYKLHAVLGLTVTGQQQPLSTMAE